VDKCNEFFIPYKDRICSDLVCAYAYVFIDYYAECQATCPTGREMGDYSMQKCTKCEYVGEFDYCYQLGDLGCFYFA
jgi:hypothetical protein